jgi:hypothetical protein
MYDVDSFVDEYKQLSGANRFVDYEELFPGE